MPRPPAPERPDTFAALANPTRRDLLEALRERGPQPAQALADRFSMARPSVSEHLRVLREAGLVDEHRAGRQRIYRLDADPLREVADWLAPYEQFWRGRLAGLRELLDAGAADGPSGPDAGGPGE
jgi:DNA-binding transcriptional ArsR family regulator